MHTPNLRSSLWGPRQTIKRAWVMSVTYGKYALVTYRHKAQDGIRYIVSEQFVLSINYKR